MREKRLAASHARSELLAAVQRIGWGLGDQSLSSLTNFVVGIAVARSVSMPEFGIYALAFSVYSLLLGLARSVATEPYAVVFTAASPTRAKAATAAATGVALSIGLAACVFCLCIAGLVPPEMHSIIFVLGLILPGLLVQDVWRQVFFAAGQGAKAFQNDLLWALLLVPAFFIVFWFGSVTAASLLLAWGLAGAAAALFGMIQTQTIPNLFVVPAWLKDYRQLWPRYLGEGLAINGSQQLVYFAVGLFGGLAAVGQLKLVLVVLGPVNVLVQGIGVVAVPEAARALAAGWRRQTRVSAGISSFVATGALVWGLFVLLLPDSWGVAIAGVGWLGVTSLVVPMVLVQIFNGSNTGPAVSLRAMGAARRSMWTRAAGALVVVISATIGAVLAGAAGAAWGMAFAATVNALNWYVQYRLVRGRFMSNPTELLASMASFGMKEEQSLGGAR